MTDHFSHNPAKSRYELQVDGLVVFADYQRSGGRLVISHVEAEPALRGTGAAGRLMQRVAETARAEGMKITPLCAYAAAWLKRNDAELIG
jgi:uncharacterized protein